MINTKKPISKTVVIFLCTYNGELFIHQQIKSIIEQSFNNWVIYASDDGSSDKTLEILKLYQNSIGEDRLRIFSGPRLGFAKNFFSLITKTIPTENQYYAYCDQDDIWKSDKLQRALDMMSSCEGSKLNLYCGPTELIDIHDKKIGFSTIFKHKPSFSNALVQCIAGGNTMIFDSNTLKLLQESLKLQVMEIPSHDWWTYILVTGANGKIFYDDYPSILYRQHQTNMVGSNLSFIAKFKRIKMLINGDFQKSNQQNIQNLEQVKSILNSENQEIFKNFKIVRTSNLLSRLYFFKKAKLFRQTLLGNLGLLFAVIFKKI